MVARAGKARISAAEIQKLLPQIELYFMESIGDGEEKLAVWNVGDGEIIRNKIFIDFTEGGNSEAYPWMGDDKIWLEQASDVSMRLTKLHELREYILMCQGWDYEEAHKNANVYEQKARDHPEQYDRIFAEQVKLYNEFNRRKYG